MFSPADFSFRPFKRGGHKWLNVDWSSGLRSAEICIDDWFNFTHGPDISVNSVRGWLSLDSFSFSFDSVGNCIMQFPTCFGYRSSRDGRYRAVGDFHSYVVVRPHFFECIKSYIF